MHNVQSYDDTESILEEDRISLINLRNKDMSIDRTYNKYFKYDYRDIGIKNPNNKSHIKIFDNGNIEIFAGSNAGVIINENYKTTNLFGESLNFMAPIARFQTNPSGLVWNSHQVNPRLYQLSGYKNWDKIPWTFYDQLRLHANVRWWFPGDEDTPPGWRFKDIRIEPYFPLENDLKFRELCRELGIPVD